MYRRGHIGASLVVYAPFGFVVTALSSAETGVLGAVVVASLATVPDLDLRVPVVKHRGITHTVWFVAAFGLALGALGALVGAGEGLRTAVLFAVFGFGTGSLSTASHLAADALTPMGIAPFAPVRTDRVTLGLFTAANPVANAVLLGLGGLAATVAVVAGTAVPV